MRFDILTLFPEMFQSYLGQGHLKRAIERGLVDIQLHNFRDYAPGKGSPSSVGTALPA